MQHATSLCLSLPLSARAGSAHGCVGIFSHELELHLLKFASQLHDLALLLLDGLAEFTLLHLQQLHVLLQDRQHY